MTHPAFPAKLKETEKAFLLRSAQAGGAGANRVWEDKAHREWGMDIYTETSLKQS